MGSKTSGMVLACEIMLIPAMVVLPVYLAFKMEAGIEIPYFHVKKNSGFVINVRLKNKSLFPISVCKVTIRCINNFTGKEYFFSRKIMLDGKSQEVLGFEFKSEYCGKYEVILDEVKIYDYFRVFSYNKKMVNVTDEIMVQPLLGRIFIGGNAAMKSKHEWEQYSHTSSGEDTSEVFDVHEYRQGDTFLKVHWKLTAKTDEYLVKEYSKPLENMIFLFADLRWNSEEVITAKIVDNFFEILSALSWSLTWEGMSHVVVWHADNKKENKYIESENNNIMLAHVEYEKDVYSMIERMFDMGLPEDDVDVKREYINNNEQIKEHNSLMVDMMGRVYRGDVCIKKFDVDKVEEEIMEWKLEI